MATNVQEIQNRIASILDQSATITAGSDDWNLRLKFIQQAEWDWSELYDWKVLYKEYNYMATSAVTQAMPSDFRRMAGYPRITYDLANTHNFEEINPQEKSYYGYTSDFYYHMMGDPGSGYYLISGYPLTSGASALIPYYTQGATLASPADVSKCPNPQYLVWRSIEQWQIAREDPRATDSGQRAEYIKQTMLEREQVYSQAQHGEVRTVLRTRRGFRIGKD